jgi:hypothetical protein
MKLSTARPRIIGLHLGEASINFIRPDVVPIKAKLAIIGEEELACGYIEKSNGWSEKTLRALQELGSCIESDTLHHLFIEEDSQVQVDSSAEPPQF